MKASDLILLGALGLAAYLAWQAYQAANNAASAVENLPGALYNAADTAVADTGSGIYDGLQGAAGAVTSGFSDAWNAL